ncbi:hypothetical protein D3C78_1902500 [compost metagenome]
MNDYDAACKASLSKKKHGQIMRGLAVSFSSGYGDGVYAGYAQRDDGGKIVNVEIDMSL